MLGTTELINHKMISKGSIRHNKVKLSEFLGNGVSHYFSILNSVLA